MLVGQFEINKKKYSASFSQPLDLSIPLKEGMATVNCFYAPPMSIRPIVAGDFVGDTQQGGLVNFKTVEFTPHGNGTHTECVGHISKEPFSINQCLQQFNFFAKLLTLYPMRLSNGDRVIQKQQLEEVLNRFDCVENDIAALIIRTMPNDDWKMQTSHSGANPPYIHHDAITYLVECGIEHLLIDLPSVDKEQDEGKLLAHKAFWQYPDSIRKNCTITELIYVKNEIKDGFYLLNIQIAAFELDASPSKPILYQLNPITN